MRSSEVRDALRGSRCRGKKKTAGKSGVWRQLRGGARNSLLAALKSQTGPQFRPQPLSPAQYKPIQANAVEPAAVLQFKRALLWYSAPPGGARRVWGPSFGVVRDLVQGPVGGAPGTGRRLPGGAAWGVRAH
jgi:hypothetical protein